MFGLNSMSTVYNSICLTKNVKVISKEITYFNFYK